MIDKDFEYDLIKWKTFSKEEKLKIINHFWDPYNPTKGQNIKMEIVNEFIDKFKINAKQFGIKNFGWNVYMLYIIVDNSKTKVPFEFLGLPINKGVIINKSNENKVIVKFRYGGKAEIDITKKIIIL
ncbi:hypothetical protein [Flavobacterium seoulense]|uniref:Uncharacterized protein n=1 Tax=Flavobacterium seoulense TaxID=1492738 RepID=A0A066WM88_9FLAO|nr:hypothetical protein [Flavobacterium seoulense]KDN54951.1 hypothetical protein FEM21_19560 [Flavobacterium seoulense]